MDFTHDPNHYELLDVSPDASPQEIRAAYVRAKASFQKDSMAIYSLMDPAEAQAMVQKIEHAYQILSHPDRKRAYDRNYLSSDNAGGVPSSMAFGSTRDKVVSIDRVPPMESSPDDDLLVPPATDYRASSAMDESAQTPSSTFEFAPAIATPAPVAAAAPAPAAAYAAPAMPQQEQTDLSLISDWSGEEIRKLRESRDFPLERLVDITRIRRSYLTALEQEEYAKLPALVFVRGFLQQISRELKLPTDRVVQSYLARMEKWTQSRKSR